MHPHKSYIAPLEQLQLLFNYLKAVYQWLLRFVIICRQHQAINYELSSEMYTLECMEKSGEVSVFLTVNKQ